MQKRLVVTLLLLAMGGSSCGPRSAVGATESVESTPTLPCAEARQASVALDVPGPGRPTPEEAAAPYAGALRLMVDHLDGRTVVLGLRGDDTVFREYHVTERADGWWPDGWAECSG